MSLFYYFVSHRPLPNSIIQQAHSNNFSIKDVTKYVKDAKRDHFYYNCDPFAIYIEEDEFDIYEIISKRKLQENDFLLRLSYEFSKLGNFHFIRMWEDNTRCATGYFEAFFQKCSHHYMLLQDFCKALEKDEKGIETDIYYTIICTQLLSNQI